MSWLRRLLLLAGLVTGAWLLGSAGEASADVKIEIDQLKVEVELPVVEVGLKVETGLVPQQPEAPPVAQKPGPRTEPPPVPAQATPQSSAPVLEAPAKTVQPKPQAPPNMRPTNPVTVPQSPQAPQPQPQAEQPIAGTLPQSGAGAATGSGQIPAGTLPNAMRPPTTTTSLISTEQQDVPRIVRAEESTFSPD
ncbi:hypothetical protein ACIA8G_34840 [Lentzea sp. NPDC051213]|uniref:hypothetical protein n=1 Tax=Lentzea sp. NPDC051213 TaxID=3364126 RepID=UPI0037A7D7AD